MMNDKDYDHPVNWRAGKCIKQARQAKGWSQKRLGKSLNRRTDAEQIERYEEGKDIISVARLYEIAEVLDKPVNSFFLHNGGQDNTHFQKADDIELVKDMHSLPMAQKMAVLTVIGVFVDFNNEMYREP